LEVSPLLLITLDYKEPDGEMNSCRLPESIYEVKNGGNTKIGDLAQENQIELFN